MKLYDYLKDDEIDRDIIVEQLTDYMDKRTCLIYGATQRWDGQRTGFGFARGWEELCQMFCGDQGLYLENGTLTIKDYHHDGVNIINVRPINEDVIMMLGEIDETPNFEYLLSQTSNFELGEEE